jgi:hypothetical protein
MQIVGDLLSATEQSGQEGIKTTALISKANLPHGWKKHICNYSKRQAIFGVIPKILKRGPIIWIRIIVIRKIQKILICN